MSRFGQNLKSLRKQAHLTQVELAQKTGIKRSAISNYEADIRTPDYETVELFADFFNVDLNYLLGRDTNNFNKTYSSLYFSDEEIQLIQLFRLVPEQDRELVLGMIEAALKSKGLL